MRPKRSSFAAALSHGRLAGPLLFAALVSPPIAAESERSLVIHHLAHWLMVVAGALIGYQFRNLFGFFPRGLVATAGLAAALTWHVPPLLGWAEGSRDTHAFAHATLLAGGAALGWAVPNLSSAARAYVFIGANVVMWPLVLAELAGAFAYGAYPGQAPAAGFVELVAMSLSWFVIFVWTPIRRLFAGPVASTVFLTLFAASAIVGWASAMLR